MDAPINLPRLAQDYTDKQREATTTTKELPLMNRILYRYGFTIGFVISYPVGYAIVSCIRQMICR